MSRPKEITDADKVLDEVFGANERATGIVGASYLEDELTRSILVNFRRLSPADEKQLFDGPRAPLGTMYAKIEIAYALSIISDVARDDLHIIRDIRNKFAHEMEIRSFDNDVIKDLCGKLNAAVEYGVARNKEPSDEPATQFRAAVTYFMIGLLKKRQLGNKMIPSPFQNALAAAHALAPPISYPRHRAAPAPSPEKARAKRSRPNDGRRRNNSGSDDRP